MSASSEKGSFRADIGQEVIDEALRSVEHGEGAPGGAPTPVVSPVASPAAPEVAPAVPAALEEMRREVESVRTQLELSQAKGRELMDKLREVHERALRSAADLDNFKKRAAREREEVTRFGNERLLKDLLPVVDNLDRALEVARTSPDFASFQRGVQMTLRVFEDALGRHGVKAFSACGQPFDPRFHEAMQQVETEAVPAGHVASEVLRGFTLNARLMRPSLVVVACAPAPTPPPPQEPQAAGSPPAPADGAGSAPGPEESQSQASSTGGSS